MRRLGCWLLAAGLVTLGALALSGCGPVGQGHIEHRRYMEARPLEICAQSGGAPRYDTSYSSPHYEGCDFPPQPCGSLPAEAP